MTTPTETAILALVAVLSEAAEDENSPIPRPVHRNEDLVSRMTEETAADFSEFINILDGDHIIDGEMLGADIGVDDAYEITQRVQIEYAVAASDSPSREARFDQGRKAIWDAIKVETPPGVVTYLGGAVDGVRLVDIISHEASNAQGLPNIKACVFVIELTFTSPDPF